ncbi:hypothetical protein N2152v2_007152 [Parachlorella kessleri]
MAALLPSCATLLTPPCAAPRAPVARPWGLFAKSAQQSNARKRCYAHGRQVKAQVYARTSGGAQGDLLTVERSALVNREIILFIFQLELDQQLVRALNTDAYEAAQEIRQRRQQVDEALHEVQQVKGPGCGARLASKSDQVDLAPAILRLKMELQQAVEQERYAEAAALRDQLKPLEEQSRVAALETQQLAVTPQYALGQVVVHATKGYRAVVCGWDGNCCEDQQWQREAGISEPNQVFYHLLVDARDWPYDDEQPPVAYVPESRLAPAAPAEEGEDVDPNPEGGLFQHPYSYLLFLGPDGQGNMLPGRQLRNKYSLQRKDVYSPGEQADDEGTDDPRGGGGGSGDGPQPQGGGTSGGFKIPGIDMSSLDSTDEGDSDQWGSRGSSGGDGPRPEGGSGGGGFKIPGIDMSSLDN